MSASLWLPLALLCALALATSDALTKKAIQNHDEYLVMWLRHLLAVPILILLGWLTPAPEPNPNFWRATLIALPLELLALILYLKALKLSPLSLTLPFLALTPVFLLVIPFLLLGETITAAGAGGILLIALGSYCLNLRTLREGGFLAPLRAIAREKGSLCMIGVAFIYSFTSTLGKMGIVASSPFYFAAFYFPALVVLLTPIALWKGRAGLKTCLYDGTLSSALLPALATTVQIVSHTLAISLTQVGYMIAVKRLSLLGGVLYGHFLFQEGSLRERALGALLMIAGVFLIVAGG